ncbi:ZIP-like iron-zinc transporter [Amanita muscaria]
MAPSVAEAFTALSAQFVKRDDSSCGPGGGADTYFGLRVASVFIVMVGSMSGAFFPVLARRSSWLRVPDAVWDFAKYFGSGVIIATAFIHLLAPAISELSSPCLDPAWLIYPYPLGLSMLSVFSIFIVELAAFRIGTAKLKALGIQYDAHGHDHDAGTFAAHGPEADLEVAGKTISEEDSPKAAPPVTVMDHKAMAQIIGVAILEFGVLLHSILIGLTLAVDPNFTVLFVVICFHQTFEGLGIGTRLAAMKLPPSYQYVPYLGALLYGITTPIGIAVGLGVRTTYNPGSTTASIVSGVLDSLSSGILLYTGLVELLAHEFLFNKDMMNAPTWKVVYATVTMCLGAGLMALLGRWA